MKSASKYTLDPNYPYEMLNKHEIGHLKKMRQHYKDLHEHCRTIKCSCGADRGIDIIRIGLGFFECRICGNKFEAKESK